VFGTPAKPELVFQDLRPDVTGNGNHIVANDVYFAFTGTGGGGPIQICSHAKGGRQNNNAPKIAVHKAKALDWAFNPFVSNMIATASEDCYVKVSQFPVGGPTDPINEALVTLEGHQKKVTGVKFHPTASNILASISNDNVMKLWNIETSGEAYSHDFGDEPFHLDWSADGSLIATMNKNRNIYLIDPRQAAAAQSSEAFSGSKIANVRWMDNKGFIAAVGGSKTSMRQLQIWDPKNFAKPVTTIDIDQSAGNIIPHYDPDNSILYLGGKGDASIKYFEIVDEDPYAHFLAEYRGQDSQKGLAFLPRRALDAKSCEIARALRLMRDSVVPISFQVPRKGEMFQADLYPDTYAGKATNDAAGYLAGKDTPPELVTMDWKKRAGAADEGPAAFVAGKKAKSAKELEAELEAAHAKIAKLEAEIKALKA